MVEETDERALQQERRFGAIEQNVAVILSNYATKEDIARLETQIVRSEAHLIKWMMGLVFATIVSIAGSVVSLARLFG